MTKPQSMVSGCAVARGIWLQQRRNVLILCSVAFGFGIVSRIVGSHGSFHASFTGWSYLAMSLSLLATFVMCSFTEADRKRRCFGFPVRLFTMPVSTATLVAAPMLCGVILACVVYVAWARFGLAGRELPLTWPLLYVAVAMICYQTIVWSLARFRITRIVVLGYAGSVLAMGWMAFRGESEFAPELSFGLSELVRRMLCWILAGAGALLYYVARAAVERQRCGDSWAVWKGRRRTPGVGLGERRSPRGPSIIDWFREIRLRRQGPFETPMNAQFWFEWRRHGRLLPLATGGILLVIMTPAPFVAPVSGGMTLLALAWILVTPLLIAFVIGKGMGKADLWSSTAGMPLFLATRPLDNPGRIGAKLKMAGASALSAWALIAVSTSIWLSLWCDRRLLAVGWTELQRSYSSGQLAALVVVSIASLVIVTFRLLAGSLYIGFSGRRWLVNAAACWVFAAIFGGLALLLACHQNPTLLARVLSLPDWVPWMFAGVFVVKAAAALVLAIYARRQGWITRSAIGRYAMLWSVMTALLVGPLWIIEPSDARSVLVVLGLFAMPLFRVSLAPLMLEGSTGIRGPRNPRVDIAKAPAKDLARMQRNC